LVKRGNYSLLRLLIIAKDAGPDGITTLALLNELGSKADRINHIISNAEKAGYIKRVTGESEHGHFPPVYNIITDKGKELLAQLYNNLREVV
jgi:DNA-binding MarR family transcriptional regulator